MGFGIVLVLASAAPGFDGGPAVKVIGVLLVVVAVNAVNLFDGLDGLAASVATVSALGLAVLADVHGLDLGFGIVLAAALLGFLVWNWPKARLFLGDNGSYTVAVFLVYGIADAADAGSAWSLLAVAGVLGMFVVDLVATLVRRRILGYPTFGGDRNHLYDQLRPEGPVGVEGDAGDDRCPGGVSWAWSWRVDALLGDTVTVVVMASVLVGSLCRAGRLGFLGRQESRGPGRSDGPRRERVAGRLGLALQRRSRRLRCVGVFGVLRRAEPQCDDHRQEEGHHLRPLPGHQAEVEEGGEGDDEEEGEHDAEQHVRVASGTGSRVSTIGMNLQITSNRRAAPSRLLAKAGGLCAS